MDIISKIKGFFSTDRASEVASAGQYGGEEGYRLDGSPSASYTRNTHRPHVERRFWNGEKNWGELGTVYAYTNDYYALAGRCWQYYTESPVASLIINDYARWIIGSGLRLEAQPNLTTLASEGVGITEEQIQDLADTIEARFKVHAESRFSSYCRTKNIHKCASEALKTAALSGDCLVIQRVYSKGGLNVEVIDGMRIASPMLNDKFHKEAAARGNVIQNGIEMNPRGGHVAYYVITADNDAVRKARGLDFGQNYTFKRIAAKAVNTGRTQAFMVYHSRFRTGYNRGIPLLSPVLEMLAKLDRYIEAAVGSAEERAKIVYFIKHEAYSTGENMLLNDVRASVGIAGNGAKNADQDLGNTADSQFIASTSGKQTYNMPLGAELKALESKVEVQFEEFSRASIDLILSALGAPPEVFRKQYNSNYSASRMAVKTWEHTLNVSREDFAFYYYKPIYAQFFELNVLDGKISAPNYLEALFSNFNHMVLESYRRSRWVGSIVPPVDPKKEADAKRTMLGPSGANVPLTTPEQATEDLGNGDYQENLKKFNNQIEGFEVEQEGGSNGSI
jgi:capsid protein